MEITIGVDRNGWPTSAVCTEDTPVILRGDTAVLWLARLGKDNVTNNRYNFDRCAGVILADRLEEYPDENDSPEAAARMAGYLRRQYDDLYL